VGSAKRIDASKIKGSDQNVDDGLYDFSFPASHGFGLGDLEEGVETLEYAVE